MRLSVYRVYRAKHARVDGRGANLVGGRWNSRGHAVVYMAESVALAVLENLVHMSREDFPRGYICVAAEIPSKLEILTAEQVCAAARVPAPQAQLVGDYW